MMLSGMLRRLAAHVAPSTAAQAVEDGTKAAGAGGVRGPIVDLEFWERHGWVVVPEVVPPAQVQAAVADIATILKMDLGDPASWYSAESGGAYGKKVSPWVICSFIQSRRSPHTPSSGSR